MARDALLDMYLKDVSGFPVLTREQECALARRLRKGDRSARQDLIQCNLRLVISVARQYDGQGMQILDIVEEGNIGLMRAVERFDPEMECRFSTYAVHWIKQGIRRSLLEKVKNIRVPAYMAELVARWKRLSCIYSDQLEHEHEHRHLRKGDRPGSYASAQGAASSNGTKATPALSGDIFGDWREEVIWKNTDSTALLIFTTTIPATSRLHTLMHDPQYRLSIAWQNVGYNQPPHPGFFLGHNMPAPPRSPIWKGNLVWRGGSAPQLWSIGSNRFKSSPIATTSTTYANGQSVLFDGSGPASSPIQIDGNISPAGIVVHNPVNHNYTFSGSGQISGATGVTKSGQGLLTLGGNHSFAGKTIINQGEFRLAGNLTASPVTLQGLGRLTGSGQLGVGFVTEKRSSISPGTTVGNIASFQISGPVTLADTTLEMDLPLSGQTSDAIAITGGLTLTGINKLVLRISSGAPAPGTYPLITFTGNLIGGLGNLSYNSAISPLENQLQISNGAINLVVLPPSVNLVWRGSGITWDKVTQNWLLAGQPQVFKDSDNVSFGPSGAAAPGVTISGSCNRETSRSIQTPHTLSMERAG